VQVSQLTSVRSSPGSGWAFGGNRHLSLVLHVWHLGEVNKNRLLVLFACSLLSGPRYRQCRCKLCRVVYVLAFFPIYNI